MNTIKRMVLVAGLALTQAVVAGNCRFSLCKAREVGRTGYCAEHHCQVAGCRNVVDLVTSPSWAQAYGEQVGSKAPQRLVYAHCKDHRCHYMAACPTDKGVCENIRETGYYANMTDAERAGQLGCTDPALPGSPFCAKHVCAHAKCRNQKEAFGSYCKTHRHLETGVLASNGNTFQNLPATRSCANRCADVRTVTVAQTAGCCRKAARTTCTARKSCSASTCAKTACAKSACTKSACTAKSTCAKSSCSKTACAKSTSTRPVLVEAHPNLKSDFGKFVCKSDMRTLRRACRVRR